jgi:hypothetical protein
MGSQLDATYPEYDAALAEDLMNSQQEATEATEKNSLFPLRPPVWQFHAYATDDGTAHGLTQSREAANRPEKPRV